MSTTKKSTLCWDCANYAEGCSWSEHFRPVKGWVATPSKGEHYDSYIVVECPKFVRDAQKAGLIRLSEKTFRTKPRKHKPPSNAQLTYIKWIREQVPYPIPVFDGTTEEEAKQYIIQYRELVPIEKPRVIFLEQIHNHTEMAGR